MPESFEQYSDEKLMLMYSKQKDINNLGAFEVLYQRHKGPLFRFIKKSITHEQDTKDIFQELWFRIINHKHSYDHKQKFTTWAYTIARRLLIDQFRHTGRLAELNRLEPTPDDLAPEKNLHQPENEFETKLMAKELNNAISLLPFKQRQTFVMKHESGLTLKEIATITSQPVEQTKSQYRYAVQKIKMALERFQ